MSRRRSIRYVAASALVLALAGCGSANNETSGSGNFDSATSSAGSQSDSHVSRVKPYGSLKELAKDSSQVVVGVAGPQSVVNDITPTLDFTLTSFAVSSVLKSSGNTLTPTTITVRQDGSSQPTQPPSAPLLVEGQAYVLFLTESGLPGDLASQYYVTGANAGLYTSETQFDPKSKVDLKSLVFKKVKSSEGDTLPDKLTAGEVTS